MGADKKERSFAKGVGMVVERVPGVARGAGDMPARGRDAPSREFPGISPRSPRD